MNFFFLSSNGHFHPAISGQFEPAKPGHLKTAKGGLLNRRIQYLKPVSSHLVVGTNLFSDFFASFTDVFGGNSETYQRKIATLYSDAIEELKAKAYELGANCIIGLSVDMDEISGKGKSMYMINATGTAVIAKKMANAHNFSMGKHKIENVSNETLENLRKRKTLIQKASANELKLDEDNWNFIIENKVDEVYPFILTQWREVSNYPASSDYTDEL